MRVFLLSQKDIFKKGMICLLGKWKPDLLIHEFSCIQEVHDQAAAQMPDLVLFDLDGASPEILPHLQQFKELYPHTRMVSMSTDLEDSVLQFLKTFMVDGHLLMDIQQKEFAASMEKVMQGKGYYDQRLTHALLQQGNIANNTSERASGHTTGMTERQEEILQMVCEEYTNKEIAEKLGISSRTVDGHRFRLIRRFGVKNTAGLIRHAMERGLI